MRFFAPLYSYRLTAQGGHRGILRISSMRAGLLLLKRLRDDVLDVRMHISPRLMERIPKRTAHAIHCSAGLAQVRLDTLLAML